MKKFLSSSLILVIGTIVAAGLNYGYNLLVNRVLTPTDYATFGALMGLVAIVGAPIGTLQTTAAKYSADYMAEGDEGAIWQLFKNLTRKTAPVGIFFFIVMTLLANPIARLLSNTDTSITAKGVVVVGIGLLFQLLLPISRGILQGSQSFFDLSLNIIVDGASRLFFGILIFLPLVGSTSKGALGEIIRGQVKISSPWVVAAAVGATVIGAFLAYILSFRPMRRWARHKSKQRAIDLWGMLRFAWPTLFMYIFNTLLLTLDIILVKKFSAPGTGLTPTNAGEYATLSTLGKLIFYVTSPMVAVMFPMVSELAKRGERHVRVLILTLFSTLAGSAVVLGMFAVAPYFIISKLAPNYTNVAYLLLPMTVIFFIYSLVNLFGNYFLSLKQYYFLVPLALGSLAEIILLNLYHSDLTTVIKMVTLSQTVALVGLVVLYIYTKRSQIGDALIQVANPNRGDA